MSKTVRRRHNKDGSVTKTTTYRHKNIFGTTVSDTFTEQITPNNKQRKKLKTSNSVAIIIFVITIFVIPIVGISSGWNADFVFGFIILAIIIFTVFMLINNIPPLKRLVINLFDKTAHNGRTTNNENRMDIKESIGGKH